MKKIILSLFIILTAVFIFLGTQKSDEEVKWCAPSEKQIENFIEKKQLKPLRIETIDDLFTIILFETANNQGHYNLYCDQEGKVYNTYLISSKSEKNEVSIGGVSSGIPFVTLIINDENIQSKAHKIKVEFENGTTVTEKADKRKGYIIEGEKSDKPQNKSSMIQIYDKDNNLLYEKIK